MRALTLTGDMPTPEPTTPVEVTPHAVMRVVRDYTIPGNIIGLPTTDLTSLTDSELVDYHSAQWNMAHWRAIESAPRDGTVFLAYAPPRHGLPSMQALCAWHESAGFCIDELRAPTHWRPLPPAPAVPATEQIISATAGTPSTWATISATDQMTQALAETTAGLNALSESFASLADEAQSASTIIGDAFGSVGGSPLQAVADRIVASRAARRLTIGERWRRWLKS